MTDDLGDRMKEYEGAEANRRLCRLLPAIARLDGKCFSSFTSDLERPFDPRLTTLMQEVTLQLVEMTNAKCGYTQSDEITLAWYSADPKSQIWFDGRTQKMCSVLAGLCAVLFNKGLDKYLPNKALQNQWPVFDCRVWTVPTLQEATNVFLWRELDATKNSISMAARHYFSHKQLMHKSCKEMQEMLFAKGVNWATAYPDSFRRGTYVRTWVLEEFATVEDLELLPPLHHARLNVNFKVSRTQRKLANPPRLATVVNRVDFLFAGADPVVKEAVDGSENVGPVAPEPQTESPAESRAEAPAGGPVAPDRQSAAPGAGDQGGATEERVPVDRGNGGSRCGGGSTGPVDRR